MKNKIYTDEQSKKWQKERVKIANIVKRKDEISKQCCICGKPGIILHNKTNPYYIAIICPDCRKDPQSLKIAETKRFDIREKLNKSKLNTSNFLDEDVIQIVKEYLISNESIGLYCKNKGISRHQFNKLIERYELMFPKSDIRSKIYNKSAELKAENLAKVRMQKLK